MHYQTHRVSINIRSVAHLARGFRRLFPAELKRFAAFGMIVEFDCRRLIVIFANRWVVLEFQNGRQLIAVRFEVRFEVRFDRIM
jgi:hypothetical protein